MNVLRSASFLVLCTVVAAKSLIAAQTTTTKGTVTMVKNVVETGRTRGNWFPAALNQELQLRDLLRTGEDSLSAVRFTDLTVLKLDELTTIEILPRQASSAKPTLSILKGILYFFSREKPDELEIRTAAANGALKGTALVVDVRADVTTFSLFEGELELVNAHGRATVHSGEQGIVEIGKAPRTTAMIDAVNILQWCLYYPAVLDLRELGLDHTNAGVLSESLAAYRAGDLVNALVKFPKGYVPGKTNERVYRAAVLLAVGQVDKAQSLLANVPKRDAGRMALEEMIAAVKFTDWKSARQPCTASEWLAHSYFLQSRSELEGAIENALKAAQQAVRIAPESGYAWTRVAELEFSRGRTREALRALQKGLRFSPRNAQAFALRGFLESAQNRLGAARTSFDEAIRLDSALGNGWLGRGLCSIRRGDDEAGRRDLQVAAALEPNRSILRSYLGKAFSQKSDPGIAKDEFKMAKRLDPFDPTPWLYSAIQNKQENRYNEAIRDLEESKVLNGNRRVYRSQFLLDQDLAVRGANLAAIYQNDGMIEQSVREAVRAVSAEYSSAPAHLFLANSYNALRDPTRILLRYETPWFNELLLSHLLSPVGGGPLSQFVSQQEYSKLFEADRLGVSTSTQYFSYGEIREVASQYGTLGNLSYALDLEYQYNDGLRPNNRISRLETYQTFKLQLGPDDTIFFQTKFQDLESGDLFQRYDNREVEIRRSTAGARRVPNIKALTLDFRELQDPALALAGWRHEWTPQIQTILLVGRLANDQVQTAQTTEQTILTTDASRLIPKPSINQFPLASPLTQKQQLEKLRSVLGRNPIKEFEGLDFDSDYRANFEIYTGELNQIINFASQTFVLGGRYQRGEFTTQQLLTNPSDSASSFLNPPANQNFAVDFERINLYAYDTWRATRWLTLTGGVAYDSMDYPENFRKAPINERQASLDKVSPKAGFILTPTSSTTIRGAYTEAINGTSFDESIRLEPTQMAGFLQAYRTVISEDLIGPVAGSEYKLWGLSLEQKLHTRTYLGAELSVLEQDVDRVIGVFEYAVPGEKPFGLTALPSSLDQKVIYREDAFAATVNQLIGDRWSIGTRYRATRSKLRSILPTVPAQVYAARDTAQHATLHELDIFAIYNDPGGFFARADALWFNQDNNGYPSVDDRLTPYDERKPGDDFWQFNVAAGYRFYKNQCELSCALLNLTGEDYRLNPLNPYNELPRDRTVLVSVKLSF